MKTLWMASLSNISRSSSFRIKVSWISLLKFKKVGLRSPFMYSYSPCHHFIPPEMLYINYFLSQGDVSIMLHVILIRIQICTLQTEDISEHYWMEDRFSTLTEKPIKLTFRVLKVSNYFSSFSRPAMKTYSKEKGGII